MTAEQTKEALRLMGKFGSPESILAPEIDLVEKRVMSLGKAPRSTWDLQVNRDGTRIAYSEEVDGKVQVWCDGKLSGCPSRKLRRP